MSESIEVPDEVDRKRIEVKVYVETAEQAAWAGDHAPPPLPNKLARERMSVLLRNEGYSLVGSSVTETSRIKVATDDTDQGWHEVETDQRTGRPTETPTGLICTFTAHGTPSDGDDSSVPIVTVKPDPDTAVLTAEIPQSLTDRGGDLRVRHDLGTEDVTIRLRNRSGQGVPYLIASDLDGNVQHLTACDRGAFSVVVIPEKHKPEPRQPVIF